MTPRKLLGTTPNIGFTISLASLSSFASLSLPDALDAGVVSLGRLVDAPSGFAYIQLALIVRALQVSAQVLLIVLVTHVNWQSVGFVQVRWLRDFLMGLGIWLLGTFAFYATCSVMPASVFPHQKFLRIDVSDRNLRLSASVGWKFANGFAEELIIRGYLLTRLECVLRSTWSAVLITSLLFASLPSLSRCRFNDWDCGSRPCIWHCILRLSRIWPLVLAIYSSFTGWLAA